MEVNTNTGEVPLNPEQQQQVKPKVVVIMGPTGSGKSRLAIDLASHFPVEIINADSMQVYCGLDVLTNKVPIHEQKGVPHHLLGSVSPNVEFTAKEFRDFAIPCINEIWSRDHVPVIVGGTNYYIQALVSSFLLDDSAEGHLEEKHTDHASEHLNYSHESLKDIDPVAANRIHPNDVRKVNQYLKLYARRGVLPSKFYQEKTAEVGIFTDVHLSALSCNSLMGSHYFKSWSKISSTSVQLKKGQNWGQINDSRFNCCFICTDATTSVLDQYVEKRVDSMIDAGLLDEVYDIFNVNANYTQGLRQAIGVREFEDLLRVYLSQSLNDEAIDSADRSLSFGLMNEDEKMLKEKMRLILDFPSDNEFKFLLEEAINKVKSNTRKLVRRQKRRLTKLQTLFGWIIHYVDTTESISSKSDVVWACQVVGPAEKTIRSFLNHDSRTVHELEAGSTSDVKLFERNLWSQYVCEACGNRVLRGSHEWEQHIQGRGHRKRIASLKKSQGYSSTFQPQVQ